MGNILLEKEYYWHAESKMFVFFEVAKASTARMDVGEMGKYFSINENSCHI